MDAWRLLPWPSLMLTFGSRASGGKLEILPNGSELSAAILLEYHL